MFPQLFMSLERKKSNFSLALALSLSLLSLYLSILFFQILFTMAKGKHRPAPGAVRKDKVIHPKSRKAFKMHSQELRKHKLANAQKIGGARLQILGDKLVWFRDNLALCVEEDAESITNAHMLEFAQAYLSRFQEELDQINMKNKVGGKKKRNQHTSRLDVIQHTMKTEKEEFEGCGLEMPDLLDKTNLQYFQEWQGELRFIQNIKVNRFKKSDLEKTQDSMDT